MRGGYDGSRLGRRAVTGAALAAGLYGLDRVLRPSGGAGRAAGPSAPQAAERHAYRAGLPGGGLRTAAAWGVSVPVRESATDRLDTSESVVALTFDDGPHPEYTPQILRVLRQHGMPATFFVLGENAERHPDLVRAMATDGHLVANHTWSHPELPALSETAVRRELARTNDLLTDLLGAPAGWARAPYGSWDPASLRVCAELGMEPLGWSVDTEDWARPGSDAVAAAVLDGVHPGAVVLLHDGGGDRSQTVAALDHLLPRLLDRGYRAVRPGQAGWTR